jgi:hypothetical protein
MRRFLVSLYLVSCSALADDLADANTYLAAREYGKALPLYTRLAKAGNPEAQFRVGEMLWFGDGTPQDLEAARRWFEKSAAAGNVDARESLAALDRRKTRGGEIDYWMTRYDGADLVAGQFDCKLPAIPEVSKTKAELDATRQGIEDWRSCYGGFAANFNASAPIGKRIPAEVLDMMSPQEAERAHLHLESVHGKVLARVQADADSLQARQLAWEGATERFFKEENARLARQNEEQKRAMLDIQRRELSGAGSFDRSTRPQVRSNSR